MKTKSIFLLSMFFLFFYQVKGKSEATSNDPPSAQNSLTVYVTPELYGLATAWAKEYMHESPDKAVKISKTDDSRDFSRMGSDGKICLVSDAIMKTTDSKPAFQIAVGREVIVPVINSNNPFIADIAKKGISGSLLAKSIAGGAQSGWGGLLQNDKSGVVTFYIMNDAMTKSAVADFLKVDPALVNGLKCTDRETLIAALQNDPLAIGFCRLTDVLATNTGTLANNIRLLPLDKNENGKLDYMENIYSGTEEFTRGVWIGKYPKSLTNTIYLVSDARPADGNSATFLQWVLTSGQSVLKDQGYSDLSVNERESQLSKLAEPNIVIKPAGESDSVAKMILLILVVIVVASVIVDRVIRRYRMKTLEATTGRSSGTGAFDENSVVLPGGLYYDKTHTWAFMEQDGTVKIGIDDFLQHVTGLITRLDLKKPGDRIRKGEHLCAIIQNGKQLNVYAPVSGVITAQNPELSSESILINKAPYAAGWVYRIEPSNWLREIEFLSMADKYRTWLKSEFTRLKDFLAGSMELNRTGYSMVVLQDGGALKDHVLAELGPQAWEDFQQKFMDVSK